QIDLASRALFASALDGARRARDARGEAVEVDRHVGRALLRVLHLGDVAPVPPEHALDAAPELVDVFVEDERLASQRRVMARHPFPDECAARLADGEIAEQAKA